MELQKFIKDVDTADRLLERIKKLDDKSPESEDARNSLSRKDRMAFDRMMNRCLGGGLPPLPPLTAYAEWRRRREADAGCTSDPANEEA